MIRNIHEIHEIRIFSPIFALNLVLNWNHENPILRCPDGSYLLIKNKMNHLII